MIKPIFIDLDFEYNLNANDDIEIAINFLYDYKETEETLRVYTREIERLLLYCKHIANICLSSFDRFHFNKYSAFLMNPMPSEVWRGSAVAKVKRNNVANLDWKPFKKPISSRAFQRIEIILKLFFKYLKFNNYIKNNPFDVYSRRKRKNSASIKSERYLDIDEIKLTLSALEDELLLYPENKFHIMRARYIILLLFYTGMRRSEVSLHRMDSFILKENKWFLKICGKGKKIRDIPVPDALLDAVFKFRIELGLYHEPGLYDKTPLMPKKNVEESLCSTHISRIIKWAFNICAKKLDHISTRKAEKLRSASTHWLRHTYVTTLIKTGVPIHLVQMNVGHSSIKTTMIYNHVSQVERHEETNRLSGLLENCST